MNLPVEFIEKLANYAYFGSLGAFAALVGYLYQLAKPGGGSRVSIFLIFATIVIGFYMGVVFAGVVPKDWENRDAVVLLIGATGLKGFELVMIAAKQLIPNLLRAMSHREGDGG
ncbi:hypothetical protein [Pseudomonas sp.]|uniref:hypothetical protein n=1 Tax=Pseudomonas sp. TaxID=306 RepID=UPI003FD8735A